MQGWSINIYIIEQNEAWSPAYVWWLLSEVYVSSLQRIVLTGFIVYINLMFSYTKALLHTQFSSFMLTRWVRVGVPFIHLFIFIWCICGGAALTSAEGQPLFNHSIVPCTSKYDISASLICHICRFNSVYWYKK